MRIERLQIENFRVHEHLDVELGPGLIGIVGCNGSGKSSFVKAILRALTGSTGDSGKGEDDVRDFADKGFVQVTFKIGNQTGTIKRHLKSAVCQMKFGDQTYRTATEANNAIFHLMGISPRVLTDMIFVEQGQLEGILFQPPAERAKSFQVLFGTDDAETTRVLLQKELLQNVPDDRSAAIKTIEADIAVLLPTLVKVDQQIKTTKLLDDATHRDLSEIVTQFQVQQRAQESAQKAREAFDFTQDQIARGKSRLNTIRPMLQQLGVALESLRPDYQPARDRVQNYAAVVARQSQRSQLNDVINRCQAALQVPQPARSTNPEELKALRESMAAMKSELNTASRILQNFAGGVLVCPTCTQAVTPEFVEKTRASYNSMAPTFNAASTRESALAQADIDYNRAYFEWKANIESSQKHLVHAQSQLNSLPPEAPPNQSAFELDKSIVSEFEATQRDCERINGEIKQTEASLATLERQLDAHSSILNDGQRIGSGGVREADFNSAKAKLDAHARDQQLSANLTGQLKVLTLQHQEKLAAIEKHRTEMANMQAITDWRSILERASSILHRDALPKMVTAAYLEPLNARLNHYLKSFQLPFSAVINSDQSLVCTFTNGVSRSAQRLSGGQKVSMGIAFRFAVYDLFAGNLGFLVLDEPTPFLDKQRRDGVLELLLQIRSYSRSSGLQVIVVTHEESLMGAFDKVIEFKEPRNMTLKPVPKPEVAVAAPQPEAS